MSTEHGNKQTLNLVRKHNQLSDIWDSHGSEGDQQRAQWDNESVEYLFVSSQSDLMLWLTAAEGIKHDIFNAVFCIIFYYW
jgi:hypothetical protein